MTDLTLEQRATIRLLEQTDVDHRLSADDLIVALGWATRLELERDERHRLSLKARLRADVMQPTKKLPDYQNRLVGKKRGYYLNWTYAERTAWQVSQQSDGRGKLWRARTQQYDPKQEEMFA